MPLLCPRRHSPLIPNHRKCYINLIQEHFSWYHLSKIHKRALSPLSPFDVSVLGDLGESRPSTGFSIPLPSSHLTPSSLVQLAISPPFLLWEIQLFVLIGRREVVCPTRPPLQLLTHPNRWYCGGVYVGLTKSLHLCALLMTGTSTNRTLDFVVVMASERDFGERRDQGGTTWQGGLHRGSEIWTAFCKQGEYWFVTDENGRDCW